MRALVALAITVVVSGCSDTVTTFNPAPSTFTTFDLRGGTIDPTHPCTPATPPATADPTAPAAAEILVGYQDWRNTVATANGVQCQTSNAKRWQGVITFDMTPVVANLTSAGAFKSLTGTLNYDPTSVKVPQGSNVLEMCVKGLEIAGAPPTTGGVVPLNLLTGGSFPPSTPPSLGATTIPDSVPFGQTTTTGPVTVDPAPPFPTVTVDISLLLSDWASARPASLPIVFVPTGPTLAALGIAGGTPVPVNRSTAQCVSTLRRVGMTVNVGR